MTSAKIPFRPIALMLIAGAAMLPAMAQAAPSKSNRGLQSVHQPVVSYQSFTYDVRAGAGDLATDERARLEGWFASIGLGYGDHVAFAADAYAGNAGTREAIANVVARHGLLIEEDDTATAGRPPEGAVRLIVRRSIATVPGCPDWSDKSEGKMSAGMSANYGCGVNSNIAAMMANPEDLVRGQVTDSDLRTATGNRAITTWSTKALTGAGDLKTIGGN